MEGLDIVSETLRLLQLVETTSKQVSEEINRCDLEHQDLIHAAELLNLNAVEMSKLAKAIKQNRQKRRDAKNTKEQLSPILEVLQKNQGLINSLKVAKGKAESIQRLQKVRVYTPRVRVDLTEEFERASKEGME